MVLHQSRNNTVHSLQQGLHVHGCHSVFPKEFVSRSIIAGGRSISRNVTVTVIYNKVCISIAPARLFARSSYLRTSYASRGLQYFPEHSESSRGSQKPTRQKLPEAPRGFQRPPDPPTGSGTFQKPPEASRGSQRRSERSTGGRSISGTVTVNIFYNKVCMSTAPARFFLRNSYPRAS